MFYKVKKMYLFLNLIIFFLFPSLSFSCVNLRRLFSFKKLESYEILINSKNNKNIHIDIPKSILLLNNKNKYDLYINKINKNKTSLVNIFPYFVFK